MSRIVLVYGLAVAYSILRYVVFAPENLRHLPALVVNKGVSMAAAICFAWALFQQGWRLRGTAVSSDPAAWFRAGLFGVFVHIPLSLAILRPAYFKEFFLNERLSFNGEAVFLFGGLTAGGLYLLGRSGWTERHRWWLAIATLTTLFAHVLCMGIARGLNLHAGHGYLPPMWLLSLAAIAAGIASLIRNRPASGDGP